jgi:hypothetical protein
MGMQNEIGDYPLNLTTENGRRNMVTISFLAKYSQPKLLPLTGSLNNCDVPIQG